jgi:hypothetical protein
MNRFRLAGVLWLVAAASAIAVTLTFRDDPVQWVVTIAVGAVAAALGLWLMARPSAPVVSASNAVSVVWIVVYGVLTALQSDELAAWMMDVALMEIGGVAGLAAYRAAAKARLG